jgi:hypothetical protein
LHQLFLNASVLAQEMRASPKGARLGEWMLKHEDALKKRPDLQTSAPRRGALSHQDPAPPPNHPPGKDKNPPRDKPNAMPLHKVECFKADKLPASKIGEFERQLKGQEDGLNRLTVDEYLENIANPVKRSRAAARLARKDLQDKLEARFASTTGEVSHDGAQQQDNNLHMATCNLLGGAVSGRGIIRPERV